MHPRFVTTPAPLVEVQLELQTDFARATREALIDAGQNGIEAALAIELVGQVRAVKRDGPVIAGRRVLQTSAEQAVGLTGIGRLLETLVDERCVIVDPALVQAAHDAAAIVEIAVPLQTDVVGALRCESEARADRDDLGTTDIGVLGVEQA